jgi:hypothetical protein
MASAGTLISDLDSKPPASDDNQFVQRILAEINQPSASNPISVPPGTISGGMASGGVINSPNPNSMAPMTMDPNPMQAHLIGKDTPSPADFARMMYQGQPANSPMGGMPTVLSPPMGNGMGAPYSMGIQQVQPMPQLVYAPPQESWLSGLTNGFVEQLKLPLLVSIVIFIMSLPAVNLLLAHYIPFLVKASGEMSSSGQLAKALGGGILFLVLYKVIIPLGSGISK